MKNQISVATKNTKKATKDVKGIKLVKGANGMEIAQLGNNTNVDENVTGAKIERIKKASQLVIERKKANESRLDRIESLSQILKDVKLDANDYLKVIELEYSVKITNEMIQSVIPSMFIDLQTEKEKEAQKKHPNRWKFNKVLRLIAKYYKIKLATEKLALRTEKALSKLEA